MLFRSCPHPLFDLQDVHTAYEQTRAEVNLPPLGLQELTDRVTAFLERAPTALEWDGTWSRDATIA